MKLFIQGSAENDILKQVEWYAEKGFPDVARRFSAAVSVALGGLIRKPLAGSPRPTQNAALAGLRCWPIKGFEAFRIYYLAGPETMIVIRVLHGKRDIDVILLEQDVDLP